ncbi:hypothetical protein BJ138DRAFT_1128397 [Hygrophoropsis aurantiaca]|uniref:Uncharacterized protein n=1 Tax=Hygrophoropsis aurantiaca TaxID=72124 RepID=A0ACB8A720_9AGAM|nr:hypothetical protein BJ138DRAFT_1128397 [Hygrophoropsis aurantiaca]
MAGTQQAVASSAAAPLRQFSFFDPEPVRDIYDLASSPEIFKNAPEIAVVISSSSGLLVADIHGSIHLLNQDYVSISSWVAHVGGRVTHMVERQGILVTIGEEHSVRGSMLRIWELGKADKKTGAPNLLRSIKVQPSNKPHPVSCIALSATLSYLAIGLGDGSVLVYRHLDQSIFSGSTSLTAVPKPRIVHESPTEPVTGLGFKEPTDEDPNLHLFIVTTNGVWSYHVSGKGSGGASTIVDEVGCGLGCATMDWRATNILLARDEAIYECSIGGRVTSYAYEGRKSSVHTHLHYLVLVSSPIIPTASSASATVRNYVSTNPKVGDSEVSKVTVIDLESKIIAYSGAIPEGVREVVSEWGHIYVVANDGKLSCLVEKPTSEKLAMLYQRGFYPLAISLAKTQRLDDAHVADVHRQYGDHLYSKGDYDGAMQQFVLTIGHTQPSYVIRKFLDAQRIHNLVTYLQELHSMGLANSDHTTLLLNTYTKLKDVARLDNFIKTESRRSSAGNVDELPFDLDTAIRVCRQAGYYEHASYLAKKYERHEDYLRVQIEDAGNYKDALMYLRRLGSEAAESNLARYGRAMLANLPEETTQLLIDICTISGPLIEDEEKPAANSSAPSGGPSYLSYLALSRAAAVPTPPPDEIGTPPSPSVKTVKPGDAPESVHNGHSGASTPVTVAPASRMLSRPPVERPSPRLYFSHFVDHMHYFVTFLETVARRRWGQSVTSTIIEISQKNGDSGVDEDADRRDQVAVWNTLLELYLTLPDASSNKDKVLRVLENEHIPYDATHALILCSTHNFTQGLVLLWEKLGMYEDVLRFWMDQHNTGESDAASGEVVKALNAYGPNHPHLYALVLRFLTSTPELLSRHQTDLEEILEHIEQEKIMPPLGVIQVLSRNGVASVGLVKQWLMTRIKEAREEIQTDQQLINSYRLETKTKLQQVAELSDPEHPRVFHITRCSECKGQLDLPSIHFMCNHSYHQRCILDHETECPICVRQHGVIQEIRRNNERLADQHDLFLSEVQENGFRAIATGFGRGMLNMTRVEDVAA